MNGCEDIIFKDQSSHRKLRSWTFSCLRQSFCGNLSFRCPFFQTWKQANHFLCFFLGDFFSTLKHVIWWDLINYPKSSQYLIPHSTSPSILNSTRVAANYLISNLSLTTRWLNFGFKLSYNPAFLGFLGDKACVKIPLIIICHYKRITLQKPTNRIFCPE